MGHVFVITGPSGVGKGTLIRGLLERVPGLELSVSATTRPPRPGERDGVDYHFLSGEEFDRRVANGEFVETAKVFDMLLAVPKYGRVKANKVLQQCRISPSKTIGGLSERQRSELVSMLRR